MPPITNAPNDDRFCQESWLSTLSRSRSGPETLYPQLFWLKQPRAIYCSSPRANGPSANAHVQQLPLCTAQFRRGRHRADTEPLLQRLHRHSGSTRVFENELQREQGVAPLPQVLGNFHLHNVVSHVAGGSLPSGRITFATTNCPSSPDWFTSVSNSSSPFTPSSLPSCTSYTSTRPSSCIPSTSTRASPSSANRSTPATDAADSDDAASDHETTFDYESAYDYH
jgi:hypothetical protein